MDKQSKIACLGAHHIRCAEHAIGLDYHKNKPYIRHGKKFYRPYRNRFYTHMQDRTWLELKEVGLADHGKVSREDCVTFWLTREGLDWLGEQIGVHIHDESD